VVEISDDIEKDTERYKLAVLLMVALREKSNNSGDITPLHRTITKITASHKRVINVTYTLRN
jgi:hypothetical protein